MENVRDFWKLEKTSLRESEMYLPDIFFKKAMDYVSFIREEERRLPAIDFGCGAGEILEHLLPYLNVKEGVDISERLIEVAAERLSKRNISLKVADAIDYAALVDYNVWLSSSAINQYLGESSIRKFVSIFAENRDAKSLFFFDTIDPDRYLLMGTLLISYRPDQVKRARYKLLRAIWNTSRLCYQTTFCRNRKVFALRGKIGFAFRPLFWMDLAEQHRFSLEIVSSRYMEYRYHVALRKERE